ncbi:hypothetical protein OTU49_009881, partial [Cherax quadricarinatus]
MSGEFGTGKTILVLAIVVGCFAVLWPKIFYPMLTASVKHPPPPAQETLWKESANVHFVRQLCYLLEEHQAGVSPPSPPAGGQQVSTSRWTSEQCWAQIRHTCGLELTEVMLEGVRLGLDKSNLTECLVNSYSLTPALIAAAAPPRIKPRPYLPQGVSTHARPERPAHLYPEMIHPALREKGRALPQRTIDKQARPGPMPGVRPPMGGAGGIIPPPQGKGSGAMGIIMPLYTVGIVVFFVYTIMKVLFKKGQDDDRTPKLKDFGLDPEYRKYVFAEEYLDNADVSSKDQFRHQQRDESRSRRKYQHDQQAEAKIEDEQLDHLRRRLEETEKAMERLMCQMGSVTDKLTAAKITEVLSQAQAQAKILKEEVGDVTSEEDYSSEALTTTLSDDTSLPTSLQRHLQELQVDQMSSFSEVLVDGAPLLEAGRVQEPHLKAHVDDNSTSEEEVLEDEEVVPREVKVDVPQPPTTAVDVVLPSENVEIDITPLKAAVDNIKSQIPVVEAVVDVEDGTSDQETKLHDQPQIKVLSQENQALFSPAHKELPVEAGETQEEVAEESTEEHPTPEEEEKIKGLPQGETKGGVSPSEEAKMTTDAELASGSLDISVPHNVQAKDAQPLEVQTTVQHQLSLDSTRKENEAVPIDSASPEVAQPVQPEQKIEREEVIQAPQAVDQKEEVIQPSQVADQKEEIQLSKVADQKEEIQPSQVTDQKEEIQPSQVAEQKEEIQPSQVADQKEEIQPSQVAEQKEEIQPSQVADQKEEVIQSPQAVEKEKGTKAIASTQPEQVSESQQGSDVAQPVQPLQVAKPEPIHIIQPTELVTAVPQESTTPTAAATPDSTSSPKAAVDQETGTPHVSALKEEGLSKKPVGTVVKEVTFKLPSESPPSSETGAEEVSSETTETGADISDFVSFAEENQPLLEVNSKELSQEVAVDTQAPVECQPSGDVDEASEAEVRGQGTQTSFALPLPTPVAESKEHSTQTDVEQGITVVGLNTSFRHDKDGVETRAGSYGPVQSQKVTEIYLDALLPSETQLLVKDTKVVDSTPMQNVEIEASEAGAVPCIVTSHVSLAFLGLEHRDEAGTSSSSTITSAKEKQSTDKPKDTPEQVDKCDDSVKHKDLDMKASKESKIETFTAPLSSPLPPSISTLTSDQIISYEVHHTHDEANIEKGIRCTTKDITEAVPEASIHHTVTDPDQQTMPPRPHSPVPPRLPEEDRDSNIKSFTQTLLSRELMEAASEGTPHPISPSLEAIAEAVAASTTRAALELLAAATTDTSEPHHESKIATSRPPVQIEEVRSEQSPVSTDESSTATTVVAISDVEDLVTSDPHTQSATETILPDSSLKSSTVPVQTLTCTPSDSPVSTPTDQIVQESVEAALAEAVQEDVASTTEKPAVQQEATSHKSAGATTVSPQNEDSPTSSKGSSPDMDEYEVIVKDEDPARTITEEKVTVKVPSTAK